MKQRVVLNENYDEIEYHEINKDGEIIYTMRTCYYAERIKDGSLYPHWKYKTSRNILSIKDSNGWSRDYHANGYMWNETNNPNPKSYLDMLQDYNLGVYEIPIVPLQFINVNLTI